MYTRTFPVFSLVRLELVSNLFQIIILIYIIIYVKLRIIGFKITKGGNMKRKTYQRFKKMVKPYIKTIILVTILALIIDVCELARPYLVQQVMEHLYMEVLVLVLLH